MIKKLHFKLKNLDLTDYVENGSPVYASVYICKFLQGLAPKTTLVQKAAWFALIKKIYDEEVLLHNIGANPQGTDLTAEEIQIIKNHACNRMPVLQAGQILEVLDE